MNAQENLLIGFGDYDDEGLIAVHMEDQLGLEFLTTRENVHDNNIDNESSNRELFAAGESMIEGIVETYEGPLRSQLSCFTCSKLILYIFNDQ